MDYARTKQPLRTRNSGFLWRAVWVLLVLHGGVTQVHAHGGRLIGLPITGAHLISCLIVGGVLLAWRERALIRWGVFFLAIFSIVITGAVVLQDYEALWNLMTFTFAISFSCLMPAITAGIAYGCVKWWRRKSRGL